MAKSQYRINTSSRIFYFFSTNYKKTFNTYAYTLVKGRSIMLMIDNILL